MWVVNTFVQSGMHFKFNKLNLVTTFSLVFWSKCGWLYIYMHVSIPSFVWLLSNPWVWNNQLWYCNYDNRVWWRGYVFKKVKVQARCRFEMQQYIILSKYICISWYFIQNSGKNWVNFVIRVRSSYRNIVSRKGWVIVLTTILAVRL